MAFAALTFFPASWPRLVLATVSTARTEAESMIAAVGSGVRPSPRRTMPDQAATGPAPPTARPWCRSDIAALDVACPRGTGEPATRQNRR